jgi:glycosyltransferase involved in cell wall biosynthesis
LSNRVSVIIITKNEEKNISPCLETVKWAGETIVIDAYSTDRTVEIAKQYNVKVILKEWEGYSAAKNFAIEHASFDWILSIDADERVPRELVEEINRIIESPGIKYNAYKVGRKAYFLGKWIKHCGWYPGYVVRLFKRDIGHYSGSRVHERLEISGEVGKLKNDLIHMTDLNLNHYFFKYNNYTSLAALDLNDKHRRFKISDIIFDPLFTFVKMYILRLGFLDGLHGFILCVLSASYVFTKYAKLWEIKINIKK